MPLENDPHWHLCQRTRFPQGVQNMEPRLQGNLAKIPLLPPPCGGPVRLVPHWTGNMQDKSICVDTREKGVPPGIPEI